MEGCILLPLWLWPPKLHLWVELFISVPYRLIFTPPAHAFFVTLFRQTLLFAGGVSRNQLAPCISYFMPRCDWDPVFGCGYSVCAATQSQPRP